MNFIALLVTVVSAFLITSVTGIWLLPILHKLHFGQTILDIGPAWHKSKQGTPTMGGLMFILGITLAVLAGYLTLRLSSQGVAGRIRHRQLLPDRRTDYVAGIWPDRLFG